MTITNLSQLYPIAEFILGPQGVGALLGIAAFCLILAWVLKKTKKVLGKETTNEDLDLKERALLLKTRAMAIKAEKEKAKTK